MIHLIKVINEIDSCDQYHQCYRIYEGDEPIEEVKFHQDELGATK